MPRERSAEGFEPALRDLAHDLRQPLSGIESIAYYLEMVLAEADPEIGQHCVRLRRMVQQTNWILNDAALSARLTPDAWAELDLRSFFAALGERLARQEECTLDLHFTEPLPAVTAPPLAPQLIEHLLAFLRDVALACDPIGVVAAAEGGGVRLTLRAELPADAPEILHLLESPSPASAVRRFFRLHEGGLETSFREGILTLSVLFAAAQQV